MQVGGEDAGSGHQALLVLALALAEQLLVPLVHHGEVRLKAGQGLHTLALAVQDVAGHGVTVSVVVDAALAELLQAVSSALHQLVNINAGAGDGQQANSGQDRVAAADVIGNDEGGPALLSSQLLEGAFGTVGRGVDALVGFLNTNGILQQLAQDAESQRGLGSRTGLGDDIDGETLALGELDDVVQGGGRDRVAAEVDLRAVGSLVVVQALDGLHYSTGTQIRTADTSDEQHIGIRTDLLCGLFDAGELFLVISNRQVKPTQEVIAETSLGLQLLMG